MFFGTSGSMPTADRAPTALLVQRGGERLLFDCGEGTQRQLVRSVGLIEVEEIFLTHFHADHVLGLPGMLKTFSLRGRERPLTVYGPPGLKQLFQGLRRIIGRTTFDVALVELDRGAELERDGYRIATFEVDHPQPAHGYVLLEAERPGHFDPDRARALGIEHGPDFGRLQRGETVDAVKPEEVMGPVRRGRKIVLAGDGAPSELTRAVAFEADLLIHEATFAHEDRERAAETRHATARAAAELATDAAVRMLALNHVSPRYSGRELRDEARAAFPNTIVPRDFDRVELPFPERGHPVHVKASDRPPQPDAQRAPDVP